MGATTGSPMPGGATGSSPSGSFMFYKGTYNNSSFYLIGNVVRYTVAGVIGSYVATNPGSGHLPTDTAFWDELGDIGSGGGGFSIIPISWADLDLLRSNKEMTPGYYLITDISDTTGVIVFATTSGNIVPEGQAGFWNADWLNDGLGDYSGVETYTGIAPTSLTNNQGMWTKPTISLNYFPIVLLNVLDTTGFTNGDSAHTDNSTGFINSVNTGQVEYVITSGNITGDTTITDDTTVTTAIITITTLRPFTVGLTLSDITSGATATIASVSGNGSVPGSLVINNLSGTFSDTDSLNDGSTGKAIENGIPTNSGEFTVGDIKIWRDFDNFYNWYHYQLVTPDYTENAPDLDPANWVLLPKELTMGYIEKWYNTKFNFQNQVVFKISDEWGNEIQSWPDWSTRVILSFPWDSPGVQDGMNNLGLDNPINIHPDDGDFYLQGISTLSNNWLYILELKGNGPGLYEAQLTGDVGVIISDVQIGDIIMEHESSLDNNGYSIAGLKIGQGQSIIAQGNIFDGQIYETEKATQSFTLDLSNPDIYNPMTKELQVPVNLNYIGKLFLDTSGLSADSEIEFIYGFPQYHNVYFAPLNNMPYNVILIPTNPDSPSYWGIILEGYNSNVILESRQYVRNTDYIILDRRSAGVNQVQLRKL